ncbi:hypothetical protein [Prevotella multiformis]|uniref:Membrane receptor RagA n=1 Tax=Prevotella multiformis DSM 16608 TaxID=888743 RepID=F0F8M7_9BACT|nr:hypothetical protein [Prevotella multiformis]EGC19404.1 hypothetical protein HMPREF9141_1944 [Prevotella multiformis DSM 16608]
MMKKGKITCKILKSIRRKIADANGISYQPAECHFEGDCTGTCPACEQEIRYLEAQLKVRMSKGWNIKVAGLAAGACVAIAPFAACSRLPKSDSVQNGMDVPLQGERVEVVEALTEDMQHSVVINGQVRDKYADKPVCHAVVRRLGDAEGVVLGEDGRFSLRVGCNDTLVFSGPASYLDSELPVSTLKESHGVMVYLLPKWYELGKAVPDSLLSEETEKKTPRSHKEKCSRK